MADYITTEHKASISSAYIQSVRYNYKNILEGTCLVIDPSSGGHSSLPAYCTIIEGEISQAEVVEIPARLRYRGALISHRLWEVGAGLRDLFSGTKFDLLAVELIHHNVSFNTVTKSLQQLSMSIGAVHASIDAKYRIVVPAWDWHSLAPEGYVKSDKGDVYLMAQALIRDAQMIRDQQEEGTAA